MKARNYEVKLVGDSPLLMHRDNLAWQARVKAWQSDPANTKKGDKGDDRMPGWVWIGALYEENGVIAMSSDNLMTMMREGGARCPTGKGKTTFKAMTQSGIIVNEIAWPIFVNGRGPINTGFLDALLNEEEFALHDEAAKAHGFELFVKRAKIGMTGKHVRVRPRFHNWSCAGTVLVVEDLITTDVLQNILTFAGRYSGLGDWRPSSKSAGKFGTFTATVKEIK